MRATSVTVTSQWGQATGWHYNPHLGHGACRLAWGVAVRVIDLLDAGHAAAVDAASTVMKEAGAKRVIPLPVSAPFHTPLMQPAAGVMA